MSKAPNVTVVVPTLNEEGNVDLLTKRIDTSMRAAGFPYSIIFIDDHSTDNTTARIEALSIDYPVNFQLKKGQQGKAQSIIQGLDQAEGDYLCMIDADLQYPPEDIPRMVHKLENNNADVALSQRHDHQTGFIRSFVSKTFNLVFIQMLFGIKYDTQSGLKVFKKDAYEGMQLAPSPWSFDLEFILNSLTRESKILTHDIQFGSRNSGEAKVDVVKTSFELAKSSILLRMKVSGKKIREAYNKNISRYTEATG